MKSKGILSLVVFGLVCFVLGHGAGINTAKTRRRAKMREFVAISTAWGNSRHKGNKPEQVADRLADVIGGIALAVSRPLS